MAEADSSDSLGDAGFVCELVDTDEATAVIKKRWGHILYARLASGRKPAYVPNFLVGPYHTLYGRPAAGQFAPTPATIIVPAGRLYSVTVLASLPSLATMHTYLRNGLEPRFDIDADAFPIVIESIPMHFRALGARLDSGWWPDTPEPMGRQWVYPNMDAFVMERINAVRQIAAMGTDASLESLLSALEDEMETVRLAARAALEPQAARLSLDFAYSSVQDKRPINFAACHLAASIFGAHADEVPVEVMLELFMNVKDPIIKTRTVWAMGRLGERAPLELFEQLVSYQGPAQDVRVRWQALICLARLQRWKSIEELLSGTQGKYPAVEAARTLHGRDIQLPEPIASRVRYLATTDYWHLEL